MSTARQIAANRANAEKSTGPVTPEGKAKSSLNRLSHGFARSNVFLSFEKKEDFKALLSDLLNHFRPANAYEQILVEKIAQNQWISLRAVALQSIALADTVNQGHIHKDLGILLRYQAKADREFHQAHAELLKARKEKANSEIGFELQNADEPAENPVEAAVEAPGEALETAAFGPTLVKKVTEDILWPWELAAEAAKLARAA